MTIETTRHRSTRWPRRSPPLEGWPEAIDPTDPTPQPVHDGAVATKDFLIIDYSGDLEKVWATMILASTSAAMGVRTRVFVTFWGLQVFVKDSKRITGENWMQKMMSAMQRPGISHRKLSKMNFLGMGPWMMGKLAKQYGVASPKELLEVAQAMGVEFMPVPDDDGHVRPQARGHDRGHGRAGRRRDRHRAADHELRPAVHLTAARKA